MVGFAFVQPSSYVRGRAWQVQEVGHRKERSRGLGWEGACRALAPQSTLKPKPLGILRRDSMVATSNLSCVLPPTNSLLCSEVILVLTSLSLRFKCMCSKYGILFVHVCMRVCVYREFRSQHGVSSSIVFHLFFFFALFFQTELFSV